MVSFSAVNRTVILLAALLLMAAVWGIGHIPDANFLMLTFTALTSALLVDVKPFSRRLQLAATWACYASAVQFLISVSGGAPFFQIILSATAAYFTFSTLSDSRAACIVMLTGYLAFSAHQGFLPAVGRCFDIFTGVAVIMAVTCLSSGGEKKEHNVALPVFRCSPYQAMMLAAELGIGTAIYKTLQLQQGPWIMMTILFINMSKSPDSSGKKLAFQRIFAVPAGIIIGGFLLCSFFRIDYKFIWLLPFIGAAGFFLLYNFGNFFLFSIIFMVTLTVFSDWMTGPYHRFQFWDNFFSRSLSSLLGAVIELLLHQYRKTEIGKTT